VYEAIRELEDELGYGPSTREIAARAGLHSTATVHMHLMALLEAGLIRRASRRSGYRTVKEREEVDHGEDLRHVHLRSPVRPAGRGGLHPP